jgi:hypothetical protein
MNTATLNTDWTWEEEVYDEATDTEETVERYGEFEVSIEFYGACIPHFDNGGEPEEWDFDVSLVDGDEPPDYVIDQIIDWARSEY